MAWNRTAFVTIIVFGFFTLLVYRLYEIQITNHEQFVITAERQQTEEAVIHAERGVISDRNGVVLSYTSEDISVSADLRMLPKSQFDWLAGSFAKIFSNDKKFYLDRLNAGSKNVLLEKKTSKEKIELVKKLKCSALLIQNDFTRIYPYGSLASHILGYTNYKLIGAAGIENNYDKYLRGRNGLYKIEKDGINRTVSIDQQISVEPIPGSNIQLTINKIYQLILDEELLKGLSKYGAESAVGIIMDPNTGEILALSNQPNYDPMKYNLFSDDARRDRAVTDTYEPGSTFKPIIMSILINEDLVNENDKVDTENGVTKVRNTYIRDTHKFPILTVGEVLEHSSNVGMSKLIDKIDKDYLYKYLRDFGFGNVTSIDLPGEAAGKLKRPEEFGNLTKKFLSFGYQISVTPIQLAAAYCALINGGFLYQPFIVRKITDDAGNTLKEFKPRQIRRVISEITSDRISSLMVGVVEQGTGTLAKMDNMFVGGKTGTAQILIDGEYSHQKYNSSFVGFLPAEKASVLIFVLFTAPEKGRYGGQVGAPVFKKIAHRLIEADINISSKCKKIDRDKKIIEDLVQNISDNEQGRDLYVLRNSGGDSEQEKSRFAERTTMPNLKNFSMRDAVAQLSSMGIMFEITGTTGRVVYQSIPPGTKVTSGMSCIIKCETIKKTADLRLN